MSRKTSSKPEITLSEAGPCGFVPVFKITPNIASPLKHLRKDAVNLTNILQRAGFTVEDTQIRPVGHAIPLTAEVDGQIPA